MTDSARDQASSSRTPSSVSGGADRAQIELTKGAWAAASELAAAVKITRMMMDALVFMA
jgi:hypothetical protein